MSTRRVLSVYADDTRVNRQDLSGPTTILQLKGQVKDGLKKKLGLENHSFHPSSKDDNDIQLLVPGSSKKITDEDTVAGLCPTPSDYILAIVPSAPTTGSPGNHVPELSLLFPIQPHSTSMPAHQANDNILNMLRALESKLETAESLRKQDAEKAEVQRKKDAEKAESRRQKDAEKAESQRKKDVQKAESLIEREEALRKKDRVELEDTIKRLEQQATEREDQWKQKHESTQRYIESLASDMDATTDFLAVGDEAGLDRIKRRNLLDRAQASLAISLGLSTDRYSASVHFRESLGPSSSLEERLQLLLGMLTEKKDDLPSQAALLMTKTDALNLLAERFPRVRLDGDRVAHEDRERSWYEDLVFRSVGTDKVALTSLLDYISPAA